MKKVKVIVLLLSAAFFFAACASHHCHNRYGRYHHTEVIVNVENQNQVLNS